MMHGCLIFICMKKISFILLIVFPVLFACKSEKKTGSSAKENSTTNNTSISSNNAVAAGEVTGKVSHKYRSTGCATVVMVMKDGEELTLIPKDKLPAELDVDGLEIRFNYRTLRMPNPEGCNTGMPAEITDVSKK